MAVILDGTNNKIVFPDGSDTASGSDVLLKVTYAENSSRQSANSCNDCYWWSVGFTRTSGASDIRITGLTHGQNNYCYPYYGTKIRLTAPNGTNYTSDGGTHYLHTQYDNGNVPLWTEKLWPASAINSQTGTWTVRFGWGHTGSGNCRPFEMINYNSNEDGRAYQRGSSCIIREYQQ